MTSLRKQKRQRMRGIKLDREKLQSEFLTAAHRGNAEKVRALIDFGIDINARGGLNATALHEAAWQDRLEVVEILLKAGADKDAMTRSGATPLHWALMHKKYHVAEMLLRHGANILARDQEGFTAFTHPDSEPKMVARLQGAISRIHARKIHIARRGVVNRK